MKKKIIIFGATGNTGAYLTEYCLDNLDLNVFEVIAVGRKKTHFFEKIGAKYYRVDITNEDDFKKLPTEEIYAVVNLAAILPAYMEGYKPEQYIQTNIVGAFNILEYCRKVKADRILYPQSEGDLSEYWGKEILLKPDMPRKFSFKGDHALYVISKNTAVDMIEHYHQEYGIKSFIFRCPTIYAYTPNEYFYVDGKKRILAYRHLMNQALKGEPIEMWGDPKKAKDIVYVRDFCQMLFKAMFTSKDHGIYNVGTGIGVTLKEQIEGLIEVMSPENKKSIIIECPEKPDSREFIMDITNAKEDLGYEPKYYYLDYLKDFKKEMELNRFKELRGE
ncbi:nucleoside-diphosphate sugar epimerase [Clostridium perfringens]|uniref:NAD-dependent epimerase/dehydratase family protein n=1 Tax=Clostridium perfringens TaxID=1502 RepID=UPI00103CC58E|nr:NAD(P)-dependent oxidoreductase [Clostridium perfringens]MDM0469386.1 NAD(P)-dependent oxidoreductase [Clostridium perfringens]MDM0626621.1 NAD(P)-dependent oxidoreductase [Clostridium perfringens]TBX15200.1 nucleoside-diphosphate sugar epimerase [Clostridium perfringens]